MNVSKALVSLTRNGRQLSTSAQRSGWFENFAERRRKRFKELQQIYQVDDGLPVYLKEGTKHRLQFAFAMTLAISGGIVSLYKMYDLAKKH